MSRSFLDNANIIKYFCVEGPVSFYLQYYANGEQFIKNINVDKKDVEFISKITSNINEDYENNLINDFELLEGFTEHLILDALLTIENRKNKPDNDIKRFYQHVADCIVGNIADMSKILQQIVENGEVDYETIADTKYNVYHSIWSMINSLDEIAQSESETY